LKYKVLLFILLCKLLNMKSFLKFFLVVIYIFGFISFNLDLVTTHNLSYHNTFIYGGNDGINCYSPFADEHLLTLNFFSFTFYLCLIIVLICRKLLPPILLTFASVFIMIGVIINMIVLLHLSQHNIGILGFYNKDINSTTEHIGAFSLNAPLNIIVGTILIFKIITQEIDKGKGRRYDNEFLNSLNNFMIKASRNPLWLFILCLPFLLIAILILTFFGQESTSLIKVFTETATWRFSQHSFPHPIPDTSKGGHYLCTVAAVGNPKLVKPIRLGKRHGKMIVVNRQLLIANAFEELVQDFSPRLHKIIRNNYDKYGLNISKQINTIFWSNTVYILMKPLEWFFLIVLYIFCAKPEDKINRQYAL